MAEETQVIEQTTQEQNFNPFGGESWTETPVAPATPIVETPATPEAKVETVAAPTTPQVKAETDTEVLDPNEWLKREYNVDDPKVLKQQLEEYQKLKEKGELKFANEESEKLHRAIAAGNRKEVLAILDRQEKIESFVSAEVNKENAADIVKFAMQQKYKDLTPSEINYKFNKSFGVPPKPVQELNDTDDEYALKLEAWQNKVNEAEMELIIEAKSVKPEIEKFKNELVLPDIKPNVSDPQISQEDLAKLEENRNRFIQAVDSDFQKFNGFNVAYKDEEVEIPVSFSYDDVKKTSLRDEVKNFNVDDFLNGRWFNEKDGSPNVTQIMEDISLLRDKEAILQKVANEVGTKMKLHYMKIKSNVSVNGSSGGANVENGQQVVNPFAENSWSQKQPVPQL